MIVSTHSKLSPSSAYRWLACPGSVREEAKYPEPPSGPGAIDGTHSHTLLEHCLKAGGGDPLKMVGVKMKDHEGEFVIDKARAERVKVAVDYVCSQMTGVLATASTEKRVSPAHLLGRDDLSGTLDVSIRNPGVLEIIDFKDGMNPVEAKDNPQLELYALGELAALKLPINGDYPYDTVKMTIVQPKMAVKGMPVITSHEMPVSELLGKIGKFAAGAAATDDPNAPLVSGAHCKYCKHKSCATRANDAMKEVGIMFPAVTNPVAELHQQAANLDPTSMPVEQLSQIILAAPLVRQMIEAAEDEALRRMKAGQAIPGLKVVNGRGSRAWALPEDEMADKLIRMGVPKGVVYETKLVTPAKAEKLTWEKTKAGEKIKAQLSERQLATLNKEYITKLGGKLTVVPESDTRAAVVLDAAPLFSAVQEPAVVEALPSWLK